MRKVLSFVLVLALVLGSFSMAFAAPFSDMANEKSSEAVTVLKDLGVVAGYPDGTFRPDQIVTRAEMARFVIAALGLEQFATGTTSKYPDMVQAPWAQGYVAYATSIGFISGYPDGTFKPNQQVSYQEAASMLVRALGYTEAFLPGGWPAEWMIKAQSLGLFDGVTMASGAAGADRGGIAQMLFNALDETIGYVDADNKWVGDTDDTMLKRLGATEGDAMVVLGSEDSLINLTAFVGKYVVPFLNSDEEIISIKDVKSTTLTGKLSAGNVFTANSVDYSGVTTDSAVTTGGAYFVNGVDKTIGAFITAHGGTPNNIPTATTVTLEVALSGKTVTKLYSASYWAVSEQGTFKTVDASDIEDNQSLFGKKFILDDNDDIDLNSFALVGAASLSSIAKDDVVYIYADGNNIKKVAVGTETVTGEVTKLANNSKEVTVNGKVYKYAKNNVNVVGLVGQVDHNSGLKAGDDVELVLDAYGYIYDFDKTGTPDKYGVVLATENKGGGIDATAKIKLFLADGTAKTFAIDSKTSVAGIVESGTTVTAVTGQIVKYSLNSDGKINGFSILTIGNNAFGANKVSTTGYYDSKLINSDAVIFTTNDITSKSADDYGVTTRADILGDTVEARYVYNTSNQIVAMIVKGYTSSDSVFGVAVDFALNNSDAGNEIEFLIDGTAVKYNAEDAAYEIVSATDGLMSLYKVTFNASGDVKLVKAIINDSDADVYNWATTDGAVSSFSNGVVKGMYTLVASPTVYSWDMDDDVFVKASTSALINTAGKTIVMVDTLDDGNAVYNIVLVMPAVS